MTQLPADGYLSDSLRTQTEQKAALEAQRDVIAETGGGEDDGDLLTRTISGGSITVPTSQFIDVRSEGHGSSTDDVLTTIDSTNLVDGRVIYLVNRTTSTYDDSTSAGTGAYIEVDHAAVGSNYMDLAQGESFFLAGDRMLMLVLIGTNSTPHWKEVGRFFGNAGTISEAKADRRKWIGMGTAAQETMSTGLDATADYQGKILKVSSTATLADGDGLEIDASGEIVGGSGGGGGGDAATLDSIDSTGFVIRGVGTTQTVDGEIESKAGLKVSNTSGVGNAPLVYELNAVDKGKVYCEGGTSGSMIMQNYNGATDEQGLRLNADTDKLEWKENNLANWLALSDFVKVPWDADGAGDFGGNFSISDGEKVITIEYGQNSFTGGDQLGNTPRTSIVNFVSEYLEDALPAVFTQFTATTGEFGRLDAEVYILTSSITAFGFTMSHRKFVQGSAFWVAIGRTA